MLVILVWFGLFHMEHYLMRVLETLASERKRSWVSLAFPCGWATHRERPVERTKREGLPPPHFTHWPHCNLIWPLITACWIALFPRSNVGRYFIFGLFGLVWFVVALFTGNGNNLASDLRLSTFICLQLENIF